MLKDKSLHMLCLATLDMNAVIDRSRSSYVGQQHLSLNTADSEELRGTLYSVLASFINVYCHSYLV